MSTFYELNGIKSDEPLPGPFYGQRILGTSSQGSTTESRHPSGGVHIHFNPNEFLPNGVSDPQGRRNLNEDYLRKRELLEAIMEKEMELEQMKKELAK